LCTVANKRGIAIEGGKTPCKEKDVGLFSPTRKTPKSTLVKTSAAKSAQVHILLYTSYIFIVIKEDYWGSKKIFLMK
jgi:hypothetical protein